MDKSLIREIISEFEQISKIVNNRLNQLYLLLGEEKQTFTKNYEIKNMIDQQRNEIMSKVEEIKRQAISQVSNTNNMGMGFPQNSMNMDDLREKMMKSIKENE